ncbi:glycosyltransferase family 2 protein [Pseudanabaena sp. PCC 6802]|uniref:glycosyltransferase family 2 protein n=1 Tax=Pseudanabaena sp. PCC 6802 TaxID=118173 RepID=UPI0003477A82|nr:glycosyltransferase family 2 protein [Pseudanabaena sp. PCC 6802]
MINKSDVHLKKTIKSYLPLWFIRFNINLRHGIKKFIIDLFIGTTKFLIRNIVPDIPLASDKDYYKWLVNNYPRKSDLHMMAETISCLKYKPVISVILPVFNSPLELLKETIESVIGQIYPYWELCIVDSASTQEDIKPILEKYISHDARIKVSFRNKTEYISVCSNSALELATGEFVALLDQDDLLTPDALYQVVIAINKNPNVDMLYSDEDTIDHGNRLKMPFFKPGWCPDSLLSGMYTSHLGVYRLSLVKEIGGFRIGYEGSHDYDLVLRLTEKTSQIEHIPRILYHDRSYHDSVPKCTVNQDISLTSKKAVNDALERRGEIGKVISTAKGCWIVRYEIQEYKKVSIIVPTKDLGNVLNSCLHSIFEKSSYPNFEVLVIDNGSKEAKAREVISYWRKKENKRFRCEILDIPFNFSKINNYAVTHTTGDYLLFLNNDVEVITSDWLEAMIEQAQRPSIGAVGALLLYPDRTVQHAGVIAGIWGLAGHGHKYYPANAGGYFNRIQTVNNYSAVTAACLMCRRKVFDLVGGFDEILSVNFNDVDLCFKMVEKGYRNIYLPHVQLYHYESKSRGHDNTYEKRKRLSNEIEYMRNKWKNLIDNDPCYSPHLTRKYENFNIRLN